MDFDWDDAKCRSNIKKHEIDFSDSPEVSPEMFAKAVLRKGFKQQGRGYQTRINALLKAYKEAHQNESGQTRGR